MLFENHKHRNPDQFKDREIVAQQEEKVILNK